MLDSIEPFVDRIVIIDGAYAGWGEGHLHSIDATMSRVRAFPKPHVEVDNVSGAPWQNEMTKRNAGLTPMLLDPSDWWYRIDGDEYIQSGVEETLDFLAKTTERYHSVNYWELQGDKLVNSGPRLCLFRYIPGMKYVENHHTMQYPDGGRVSGFHARYGLAKLVPLNVVHDRGKAHPRYRVERVRYGSSIRPYKERKDWWEGVPQPDYTMEPPLFWCPKCLAKNPMTRPTPMSAWYGCRCGFRYEWTA